VEKKKLINKSFNSTTMEWLKIEIKSENKLKLDIEDLK